MENEKKLTNFILDLPINTVLTHYEIENITDLKQKSSTYYTLIKHIEKRLIKNNRGLLNKRGVGYIVLGPEGLVDKAVLLSSQGEDKIKKARDLIQEIDTENLDHIYKLKLDYVQLKFNQMYANLAGGVREILISTQPKEINIRRK